MKDDMVPLLIVSSMLSKPGKRGPSGPEIRTWASRGWLGVVLPTTKVDGKIWVSMGDLRTFARAVAKRVDLLPAKKLHDFRAKPGYMALARYAGDGADDRRRSGPHKSPLIKSRWPDKKPSEQDYAVAREAIANHRIPKGRREKEAWLNLMYSKKIVKAMIPPLIPAPQ